MRIIREQFHASMEGKWSSNGSFNNHCWAVSWKLSFHRYYIVDQRLAKSCRVLGPIDGRSCINKTLSLAYLSELWVIEESKPVTRSLWFTHQHYKIHPSKFHSLFDQGVKKIVVFRGGQIESLIAGIRHEGSAHLHNSSVCFLFDHRTSDIFEWMALYHTFHKSINGWWLSNWLIKQEDSYFGECVRQCIVVVVWTHFIMINESSSLRWGWWSFPRILIPSQKTPIISVLHRPPLILMLLRLANY